MARARTKRQPALSQADEDAIERAAEARRAAAVTPGVATLADRIAEIHACGRGRVIQVPGTLAWLRWRVSYRRGGVPRWKLILERPNDRPWRKIVGRVTLTASGWQAGSICNRADRHFETDAQARAQLEVELLAWADRRRTSPRAGPAWTVKERTA